MMTVLNENLRIIYFNQAECDLERVARAAPDRKSTEPEAGAATSPEEKSQL